MSERGAKGGYLITYTCPSCNAKCSVGDEFAGRKMKCPKCGARIRHHPGAAIELLSAGVPPAVPLTAAPAAPAWSSMDPAPPAPPVAPPTPAVTEPEKKGSTVKVAVVPEFVGKLVSQSESKQNIMVVWGVVGFLALAVSAMGLVIRSMILGVAPIALALGAAFVWLTLRAKKRAAEKKRPVKEAKPAAKDEGKTEPLPKS